MLARFRMTIGRKIYALIALGFVGLLGMAFLDSRELAATLKQQKQIELQHLVDLALAILKEENDAVGKGAATAEEARKRATGRIAALRYGGKEYFFIVDMQTKLVMNPLRPEMTGRDMSGFKDASGKAFYKEIVDTVARHGSALVGYDQLKPGIAEPQPKLSYAASFAPWGWVVVTGVYIDDLAAQTWASTRHSLLVASVIMALMLLVSIVMARRITTPLRQMTATMKELAAGKLDVAVPGIGRHDEVGEMAAAVEVFKTNAVARQALEAEQRAASERVAEERKQAVRKIADEFEDAVGEIINTVSSASAELESAAETLTHTAETTERLTATVVSASEQASSNVQSVASATNEMTSSVGEISRQVHESTRIAAEAVKQAEATDGRIGELSQAASRIGDVVKLITAIAEQTNLLALNATIEAARAGETGKGFAVVAQEVKALAAQTGKATGEIGAQISGMQAATQDSVAAIKEIGGTIGRIAEIASAIAAAVEQQGAATAEVARNIEQASHGTTQVAANIVEVSRGASDTETASAQVRSSAGMLSTESNKLKQEVRQFLMHLRV